VKIELGKKSFFWIGLLIVFAGVGFVYSYDSGLDASVMGHNSAEVSLDGDTIMNNDFCLQITGHNCSVSCPEDEFLDGDGDCWNVSEITAGVGGGGTPPEPSCDPGYCSGNCQSGNGLWECHDNSCICRIYH